MASPPANGRQSGQWTSPRGSRVTDFLFENRNTELNHKDALDLARLEHERVRLAALRVYEDHENEEHKRRLQLEKHRIKIEQQKEEERLRNEESLRNEEQRLRELKAKTIPQLPPEPTPQPAPTAATPAPTTQTNGFGGASGLFGQPAKPQALQPVLLNGQSPAQTPPVQTNGFKPSSATSPFPPPTAAQDTTKPSSALTSVNTANAVQPATTPQAAIPASSGSRSSVDPDGERYVEIHQNLKKLRQSMMQQAKMEPQFKARMGDMRREIRKYLGQLVQSKPLNKEKTEKIAAILRESLTVPSIPINPSQFLVDPQRQPMDGAVHNGPELPSLFLFLLNMFAKYIVGQFTNECGPNPLAADPIGTVAASIFSKKEHLWRGKSLIDIVMAKMRVACPVLFGYAGNDKDAQGRKRLGWKMNKDNGQLLTEDAHWNRMRGLAAGYSSIALRNFSRVPATNPWPPSKYWTTMARIVNTPPADISDTQCIVLRGLIETYEEAFIRFYGNAAMAALRSALVDFPNKAPARTPAVASLQNYADYLKKNAGIVL
ncbi:GLE1-domain-containing protein [Xylariaceae sp. FL1019]|nr:GLE1-domain-containing protein [Xylariaceae sp. FL1019]